MLAESRRGFVCGHLDIARAQFECTFSCGGHSWFNKNFKSNYTTMNVWVENET
jgi:hypothetical protein